jgi:hypothetical protein
MAKMESGLVGGQENEVDADEYPLFFFFFFFSWMTCSVKVSSEKSSSSPEPSANRLLLSICFHLPRPVCQSALQSRIASHLGQLASNRSVHRTAGRICVCSPCFSRVSFPVELVLHTN